MEILFFLKIHYLLDSDAANEYSQATLKATEDSNRIHHWPPQAPVGIKCHYLLVFLMFNETFLYNTKINITGTLIALLRKLLNCTSVSVCSLIQGKLQNLFFPQGLPDMLVSNSGMSFPRYSCCGHSILTHQGKQCRLAHGWSNSLPSFSSTDSARSLN